MSSSDFFRKYQPLFEAKEKTDVNGKSCAYCGYPNSSWKNSDCNHDKWVKAAKEKENTDVDKKPKNVEETSANFFRKYSDIIAEAEEDKDDSDHAPPTQEVIVREGRCKSVDKEIPGHTLQCHKLTNHSSGYCDKHRWKATAPDEYNDPYARKKPSKLDKEDNK